MIHLLPMPTKPKLVSLPNLHAILSYFYDSGDKIRHLCRDIELDVGVIPWDVPVNSCWNKVLDEAQKAYKVGDIYVYARQQYQPSLKIREAFDGDMPALDEDTRNKSVAEANLFDLLNRPEIPKNDIFQCYKNSMRDVLAKEPPEPSNLAHAIIDLWNMSLDSHGELALTFAQRVANTVSLSSLKNKAELSTQITQWMDKPATKEALRMRTDDVQHIRDASAAKLYLLVTITPDTAAFVGTHHERFRIDIYPYYEASASHDSWREVPWLLPQQWVDKDESFPVEDLPQIIHDTLNEHESEKPAVIEFFLPLELIEQDVDQWEVVWRRYLRRKLLARSRIVVRSWDRETANELADARQARQTKWKIYKEWRHRKLQKLSTDDLIPCLWDDPRSLEPKKVFDEYNLRDDLAHTCIGMTFQPPAALNLTAPPELLDTMIGTGVPIMLWSRRDQLTDVSDETIRGELKKMLSNAALCDLPEAIHNRRTCEAALADPRDLGNHLTLFWDNPDHSLPKPNKPQ